MSRSPGFGYFLFILLNATLFIRPHELFPELGLGVMPIYNVIMIGCLTVSASAVFGQFKSETLRNNPVNVYILCFLASAAVSHLSHFRIAEALTGTTDLSKILLYYFLLVGFLDTFKRLRGFLLWLGVLAVVLVSLSLLHYYHFVNIPTLEAYHEFEPELDDETGGSLAIDRLTYTGIYGNPNDLSRILVIGILISLYFLGDSRLGLLRPLWLLPIAMFGLALHLTHSRGGLLALFAGIGVLFYNRYGMRKSLLLGGLILPILLVAFGGRQTDFSTSGGTAQERIKLWNEGLVLLQGSPLFGIGMDQYGEHLKKAAHNSFVHCYVELGFIGGSFFFAIFCLLARVLWSDRAADPDVIDPELSRLRPFLLAILLSAIVGMFSASRCYYIPTYMAAGLCMSYLNLMAMAGHRMMPKNDTNLLGRLFFLSVLALAGLYVYVRLKSRY